MVTVDKVFSYLNELFPLENKIESDNPGFLVGRGDREVTRIMVALDITPEVIEESVEWGAELIVSHHPVIYSGLLSVTDNDFTGERVLKLAECGISAICMHTNADISQGGVNDLLAARIGLKDVETVADTSLSPLGDRGVCRIGNMSVSMQVEQFAPYVAKALGGNGVKYYSSGKPVKRVAVGGGSCGVYIALVAAAGCDTFVTSDVKHGQILEAKWRGINILDAGHFATEDVLCPAIVDHLSKRFTSVEVKKSERLADPMRYVGV